MKKDNSINAYTEESAGAFRMPAEFEPHDGCLMIWPERPGSWKDGVEAEKAFATVACTIAGSETVYMMVSPEKLEQAKKVVADYISKSRAYEESKDTDGKKPVSSEPENAGKTDCDIVFIPFAADDSWARDTGPTFVVNGSERRGVDWGFNAWGGDYDGLYTDYDRDALVAVKLCEFLGDKVIDKRDFILEGGSIHVDGEGTLITTEECLLSPGRNPKLSKEEIENKLKEILGVKKIIWLPAGVYNDETNGHVDNFCCFSAPGEVLLAWTDRPDDPNFERCREAYEVLSTERDARGRRLEIRKLPLPDEPIVLSEEDLKGYVFEEGEDTREAGERLAASYVNFYISNKAVIFPCFGYKAGNRESDIIAAQILSEAFPDREIVGIVAPVIILGGGNIHCITQQIPKIK